MRRPIALAVVLAALVASPRARAGEQVRLLVSVGANVGDPDDVPLRFATADAERVHRLFVELGDVSSDRAYLLLNPSAALVRQRLAEVGGRIAELRASGHDVVLIVYASSHARGGHLNLAGTHLPLAELREFAAGSGARVRVLMIDACDSGAITRRKGGTPGPGYEVNLERMPLHGQVMITSSGAAEASEEWESLQGSLFTHHLLTGLRGDADADGDGKITLAEVYPYAYRRTVAGAAGSGQHPAFDLDLAGTGELVLSAPARARSAIVFPAAVAGRFVVASQPRADVVAEVDKEIGKALRIAVPAGRYLVRKREGHSTGLLEVELPYGGERTVREKDLLWRNFAEVAIKGGFLELRPWSATLFGGLGAAAVVATGPRWSGGLGLQLAAGDWWMRATLEAGAAGYRGDQLAIDERSLALELGAGYRWLTLPVIPKLGLAVEALGLQQRFTRDREAQIRAVFPAIPNRNSLGLGVGPTAGLEIPLPDGLFASVDAALLARQLASQVQPELRLVPKVHAGVGLRF